MAKTKIVWNDYLATAYAEGLNARNLNIQYNERN